MTAGAPRPRVLGSLRSAGGHGVVRIEDRYGTGVDDVWSAVTEPGRLACWYDADATGRVEACEPPRRLLVTTRETEQSHGRGTGVPPYDEALDVTLTADGDQTAVVIEVRGMPLDAIAFYGVGWQIHAEDLAAYLGGRPRADTDARWDDLLPAYQELAATISQP